MKLKRSTQKWTRNFILYLSLIAQISSTTSKNVQVCTRLHIHPRKLLRCFSSRFEDFHQGHGRKEVKKSSFNCVHNRQSTDFVSHAVLRAPRINEIKNSAQLNRDQTNSNIRDVSSNIREFPSRNENQASFWPPWPFNLLKQGERKETDHVSTSQEPFPYKSGASIFFLYCRKRAKLGIYQVQQVLSDASFHLPPSAPVLIPLAILPFNQGVQTNPVDPTTLSSLPSMPRLFIHRISRNIALASLGVAVLSWAHYEVQKTKRLTPLPLTISNGGQELRKAILPPFLPERIPPPDPLLEHLVVKGKSLDSIEKEIPSIDSGNENDINIENAKSIQHGNPIENDEKESMEEGHHRFLKLRQQILEMYGTASKKAQEQLPLTFASTVNQWKIVRLERKRTMEEANRNTIFRELMELQSLKSQANLKQNYFGEHNQSKSTLGYALVTGASRGLGRAIAVELARWEIPLILVARDTDKLQSLADDIEACYGVQCCIVQADLSKPQTADKLYQTTKDAGMHVDILVNNAGICTYGEMVDTKAIDIDRLLQLNAISVSKLAHLYGKDMKKKKRGRILFVSSIVGALPSGPGIATYAATKAFEKSLALSMGKELESYGVGVTCLMPGAIKGTAFTSPSSAGKNNVSSNALCWHLPFYPKTAPEVAAKGVRALLSGDAEVVNGWQNRLVVRIVQPLLPQRLTSMIVETTFAPLKSLLPFAKKSPVEYIDDVVDDDDFYTIKNPTKADLSEILRNNRGSLYKTPPRILKLYDDQVENESENTEIESNTESLDPKEDEITDTEDKGSPSTTELSHDESSTQTTTKTTTKTTENESLESQTSEEETTTEGSVERSLAEYKQHAEIEME